jgi:chromosome partitioning protein
MQSGWRAVMKSIGLVSQKGGAGKTTLAIHLAVLAQGAGMKTALIDCDPQRSAGKWYRRRLDKGLPQPEVAEVTGRELLAVLTMAKDDGYDCVVVDTAPHANTEAAEAVRAVNYALIPCQTSILDMDAIGITVDLVRTLKKPAAVVLNACAPGRGIAEAGITAEARTGLAGYGLPVAPVAVVKRAALAHALIDGRAVTEYDPDCAAAQEMHRLWSWIREQMA